MAYNYLLTAFALAVSLNAANRWWRAAGTLLAALGLGMITLSILIANTDGTFARMPAGAGALGGYAPLLLNAQAAVGAIAAVFLLWASWSQTRRSPTLALPSRNTPTGFGRLSRYAHWTTAVLLFVAFPMGLFLTVLTPAAPERAEFAATHQSLGLAILILVAARLLWLAASPPPPIEAATPAKAHLVRGAHIGLYALIVLLGLSGALAMLANDEAIAFFGLPLAPLDIGGAGAWRQLHGLWLPLVFYSVLALHIGAVIRNHFIGRRTAAIRRMLR